MPKIAPTRRHLTVASAMLAALAVTPIVEPSLQDPATKPEAKAGPQVGQPAPTGRLNDHEGHAVTVGGKSDKWTVLAFYPKAATPG